MNMYVCERHPSQEWPHAMCPCKRVLLAEWVREAQETIEALSRRVESLLAEIANLQATVKMAERVIAERTKERDSLLLDNLSRFQCGPATIPRTK